MRRLLALLLLSCAATAGCTKTQAKTPVAPPPLVTPTPPDRMIVPAPTPEAIDPPVAPAPPPTTPARPNPPTPAPPRPSTPTTPPASPPAATAEPTPPPVLQTTPNPVEVEQKARTSLSAAQRDLDLINPRQLTANARAQYDTARAFVKQADSALKVRNVVLARELADKAAALASQLRR